MFGSSQWNRCFRDCDKVFEFKKKSEIIVPANTWISTAESVINNNHKLRFVDVDETHNICVKDLKKKFLTIPQQ